MSDPDWIPWDGGAIPVEPPVEPNTMVEVRYFKPDKGLNPHQGLAAPVDTDRMAETRSGSGRSLGSAVPEGQAPTPSPFPHPIGRE